MFVGSANNEIGGISSQSGASTSQPSAPGQGRTPAHRQQQYQPTISTADPMGLTHVSINNLTNQNARSNACGDLIGQYFSITLSSSVLRKPSRFFPRPCKLQASDKF